METNKQFEQAKVIIQSQNEQVNETQAMVKELIQFSGISYSTLATFCGISKGQLETLLFRKVSTSNTNKLNHVFNTLISIIFNNIPFSTVKGLRSMLESIESKVKPTSLENIISGILYSISSNIDGSDDYDYLVSNEQIETTSYSPYAILLAADTTESYRYSNNETEKLFHIFATSNNNNYEFTVIEIDIDGEGLAESDGTENTDIIKNIALTTHLTLNGAISFIRNKVADQRYNTEFLTYCEKINDQIGYLK